MKLKPNMYARTKYGYIAKCIYIDEELESIYGFDSAIRRSFGDEYDFIYCEEQEKYIIKTSHNIIDLIEVGDYVNGYYVSKIWKSGEITHYVDEKPIRRKERQITIQAPSYGGIIHLHNKDIKSIVTKEAFESMNYKVEG